jgi:hypothetical protein
VNSHARASPVLRSLSQYTAVPLHASPLTYSNGCSTYSSRLVHRLPLTPLGPQPRIGVCWAVSLVMSSCLGGSAISLRVPRQHSRHSSSAACMLSRVQQLQLVVCLSLAHGCACFAMLLLTRLWCSGSIAHLQPCPLVRCLEVSVVFRV